ncbi:MAG TPA: hypothetical protein VHB50_12095 [Bryobacteraceae bacterium]|jgi:hypothetical protein|nr:hypothetical protein [Bryobacteraceae bacterium]
MWCVTISSFLTGEVLRREYFDSRTAAEIRGFQIDALPAAPSDHWSIAIDLIH